MSIYVSGFRVQTNMTSTYFLIEEHAVNYYESEYKRLTQFTTTFVPSIYKMVFLKVDDEYYILSGEKLSLVTIDTIEAYRVVHYEITKEPMQAGCYKWQCKGNGRCDYIDPCLK